MKEEHKLFLVRALILLHKPKSIAVYHQQLSYCITQFVGKDYKLADKIVAFDQLPEGSSFATQAAEFQRCMVPLFRQIARCLNSSRFQNSQFLKRQRRHSRNPPSSSTKAAMSESSTNSTRSNRYCFCGMKIKRRTSWTDLNPGRRFEACDQNRNSQTRHHFFEWLDNETCPRGKEVLPGLLRILRGMEEEIRARDEQLRLVEVEKKKLEEKVCVVIEGKKELEWSRQRQLKLGFALILSWCLFVILVMSRKI